MRTSEQMEGAGLSVKGQGLASGGGAWHQEAGRSRAAVALFFPGVHLLDLVDEDCADGGGVA